MAIPNLLLNINYKETCGQSSVIQHLLSYSFNTGVFPQSLNDISTSSTSYLYHKNGNKVLGMPNLHDDFIHITKQENYLDLLEKCISKCVDIDDTPILDSSFKFCLPTSVNPGNLIEKHPEQCMYFASQSGPMYIYDYNARFKKESTIIVNEQNIAKLYRWYNLEEMSFDMFLQVMGRKISTRMPSQAANFIKDKPIALLNMALEHGLEYTIEEGLSSFIKDFMNTHDSTTNYGLGELPIAIIDVNELTSNTTNSADYYKYMCDSLNVSINTELFNLFENTFIKASTEDRLKIITGSKFLKSILCNEPYKD